MPRPPEIDHAWAVRVRRVGPGEARVYARNHSFSVGRQASLRERDEHASALEYLLGALGGDLAAGLEAQAARRHVGVDALEVSLEARLGNVLVHLGVIGEEGHPGVESIRGTVFVSADCDEQTLDELWRATLERSPLYHTLARAAELAVELRAMP